jgi:hypothetical protein
MHVRTGVVEEFRYTEHHVRLIALHGVPHYEESAPIWKNIAA